MTLLGNPPDWKEHEAPVTIFAKICSWYLASLLTRDNLRKLHVAFYAKVELKTTGFTNSLARDGLNVNVETMEPTIVICIEIDLPGLKPPPYFIAPKVR
jgi:hypothetical protein|mmetsp:Transcript_1923/g.5396  ORF Transcript_1923/g.5396 Transcript_1923/m.5396 type:complete len:99 (-) Transcript_1923:4039-4335(-)